MRSLKSIFEIIIIFFSSGTLFIFPNVQGVLMWEENLFERYIGNLLEWMDSIYLMNSTRCFELIYYIYDIKKYKRRYVTLFLIVHFDSMLIFLVFMFVLMFKPL